MYLSPIFLQKSPIKCASNICVGSSFVGVFLYFGWYISMFWLIYFGWCIYLFLYQCPYVSAKETYIIRIKHLRQGVFCRCTNSQTYCKRALFTFIPCLKKSRFPLQVKSKPTRISTCTNTHAYALHT